MTNQTRKSYIVFLLIMAAILFIIGSSGCQTIKPEDRAYATIVLGPIFCIIMGCVAWYTFWVLLFSPTAREKRKRKSVPVKRWYTEEQMISYGSDVVGQCHLSEDLRWRESFAKNVLKQWNQENKPK